MIRLKYLRADDYIGIASMMLLRLDRKNISIAEAIELKDLSKKHRHCGKVRWGPCSKVTDEVLELINVKRSIDGRPPMDMDELKAAIRSYLCRPQCDPRVFELNDALNNIREKRLGLDKFEAYMPIAENSANTSKTKK